MSGQLRAAIAISLGEKTQCPMYKTLGGVWEQSRSARLGDEMYPLLGIELLLVRVNYAISALCVCSCSIKGKCDFPNMLCVLRELVSL